MGQAHHPVDDNVLDGIDRTDTVGYRGLSLDWLRGLGELSRCGCRRRAGHGHEQQHHQHRRAGAGRQGKNLSAPEDGYDALTRLDLGQPRLLDGGEGRLRLLQPIAEHDVRREHPLLVLDVVSRALVGLGKIIERDRCGIERGLRFGRGRSRAELLDVHPHGLEAVRHPANPPVRGLIGSGIAELRRAQIQQASLDRLRGRVERLGLERSVRCFGVAPPEEERGGGDGDEEETEQNQAGRTALHETLL